MPVVLQEPLDLQPVKIAGEPEPFGCVVGLGLEFEAAGQLPQRDQDACQVVVGDRAGREVVLDPNVDGLFEVGDAAELTAKDPGEANGRKRPQPCLR